MMLRDDMLRDDDPPARRIEKLTRIAAALIDRLDRLEERRGSGWTMFQAALALEQEVIARRRELERAMADLSQKNRELAEARTAAEEANRSRTRFLRAASHDLLQPLSAARLYLAALSATAMNEEQAALVARLSGALESVETLMNAVLDIARLDGGQIAVHRQPVALDDLFRKLDAEFTPLAQARGLALRFLPSDAMVDSDPVLLRRIAQNLIANAVKYTQRGGVVVSARWRQDRFWLTVSDTGPGIPLRDQDRIFDEFQRLDHDGTPGMGLGLSIVRLACTRLDHPIRMWSRPGRGTRFRIGLPQA